jgi:hypothetical protein
MISFTIIFIDQDSEGEICSLCKKEIKGKKWVMMLDFGDPVNFPPHPFNQLFCTICKINIEKIE